MNTKPLKIYLLKEKNLANYQSDFDRLEESISDKDTTMLDTKKGDSYHYFNSTASIYDVFNRGMREVLFPDPGCDSFKGKIEVAEGVFKIEEYKEGKRRRKETTFKILETPEKYKELKGVYQQNAKDWKKFVSIFNRLNNNSN